MKARLTDQSAVRNSLQKVYCTNPECGEDFKVNVIEENLGHVGHFGEVNRKYMLCPHCGTEYNFGFINDAVREYLEMNESLLQNPTLNSHKKIKSNKTKGMKISDRIQRYWQEHCDQD